MNHTHVNPRARSRSANHFFYIWLLSYFCGTLLGIYAANMSYAQESDTFRIFCNEITVAHSLLLSAIFLVALIILLSNLPANRFSIPLLFAAKAFSTAFVFGILYLLKSQTDSAASCLVIALHALLMLPAYYFIAWHCSQFQLFGRGLIWFRYRLMPVILAILYIVLAVSLERLLFVTL